jgi:hypothetical protein
LLGEHSLEICRELGYKDATVKDLVARGVIQQSECDNAIKAAR